MSSKIRNITYIGLMAAVISVISVWQIPVPLLGVGMTLQTFAVCLAGYTLKKWRGTVSVLLYIVIGAVGIPVFSGFQGGFSVLLGPSGGFIFGFIPLCILCSLPSSSKPLPSFLFGIIGLVICHGAGVLQYCIVAKVSLGLSFLVVSLPYILKDIISVFLAKLLASQLIKRIGK